MCFPSRDRRPYFVPGSPHAVCSGERRPRRTASQAGEQDMIDWTSQGDARSAPWASGAKGRRKLTRRNECFVFGGGGVHSAQALPSHFAKTESYYDEHTMNTAVVHIFVDVTRTRGALSFTFAPLLSSSSLSSLSSFFSCRLCAFPTVVFFQPHKGPCSSHSRKTDRLFTGQLPPPNEHTYTHSRTFKHNVVHIFAVGN